MVADKNLAEDGVYGANFKAKFDKLMYLENTRCCGERGRGEDEIGDKGRWFVGMG